MKVAVVESVCECQAKLFAELDERRRAIKGWSRQRGRQLPAPANSIGPDRDRFDIGWMCPFCTRNTLRSFLASTLSYRETMPTTPSVPPAPVSGAPR